MIKMCFRPGCVQALGTDGLRLRHKFHDHGLAQAGLSLKFCSNYCLAEFLAQYSDSVAILRFIQEAYRRWLKVERRLSVMTVKKLYYSQGEAVEVDFAVPTRGENGCSQAIITLGFDSLPSASQFLTADRNDYLSLLYFLLSLPIPRQAITL